MSGLIWPLTVAQLRSKHQPVSEAAALGLVGLHPRGVPSIDIDIDMDIDTNIDIDSNIDRHADRNMDIDRDVDIRRYAVELKKVGRWK